MDQLTAEPLEAAGIPSIRQLRALCDKPRRQHWYIGAERNLNMWVSAYLTKPLLLLRLSADQVTLLSLLVGWAASACWTQGTPAGNLAGALGVHLFYLLDFSDGAIARYRGTSSIHGAYSDHLVHYLVQPPVFAAIGLGWWATTRQPVALWIGLIAAAGLAVNGLIYDVKQRTLLEHLHRADPAAQAAAVSAPSVWRDKVTGLFHLVGYFPTAMYLFTLAALLDWWGRPHWRISSLTGHAVHAILLGYAAALPIQCVLRWQAASRGLPDELQRLLHERR